MKLIGQRLILPARQQGAVLLIALVMLVVITLLAVSGMREVTLESRITGNMLEQKRLSSSVESGLIRGEKTIKASARSPQMCTNDTPDDLCITAYLYTPTATDIYADFSSAFTYDPLVDKNGALDRNTRWYVRRLDAGGLSGEAEDPEYGRAMGLHNSKHYFEINSQSSKNANENDCLPDTTCIRSVVSKIFNNN
jgi:type IV pilus assembly protein PilX